MAKCTLNILYGKMPRTRSCYHYVKIPYRQHTLQRRHNECDGVSNYRRLDCPLNRLFKENIKAPRHWPLWGEYTGEYTAGFPSQKASNVENASI